MAAADGARDDRRARRRRRPLGRPRGRRDFLKSYQQARLTCFVHPSKCSDRDTRYNLEQSIVAVGAGQVYGRGVNNATQTNLNFLPEHGTDFVFASYSEQRGFVGAALLLALYLLVLWRALRIVSVARDFYSAIVAGGIVIALLFQIFVNVGMTMGIAPITGIPLPFVSVGGSSMIANLAAMGVLLAIYARGRAARRQALMKAPVSIGAVRKLIKELQASARDRRPLAVGGARELASVLARDLGRGGDPSAVRVGDPAGAAVYVHIATGDDEEALRRAHRARVPAVAVAQGDAPLPFVPETDVVRLHGASVAGEEIAAVVAARLGDAGPILAARLPVLRGPVCDRVVASFARKNGLVGAAVFIPGADLPVLLLNQVRMLLLLDQAYGLEMEPRERLPGGPRSRRRGRRPAHGRARAARPPPGRGLGRKGRSCVYRYARLGPGRRHEARVGPWNAGIERASDEVPTQDAEGRR